MPVKAPSDAQIFALLHEANVAEMEMAKIALDKSQRADVKAFARAMIADHTNLLADGTRLADSLAVAPQLPANDSLTAHIAQETRALTTASPSAFDRTYMDGQIQDHQTVLSMLQQFESEAQHLRLKAYIAQVEPVVTTHLDRAQAVEAKVTSA